MDNSSNIPANHSAAPKLQALGRLLVLGSILGLMLLAGLLATFRLIDDSNDYAEAALLKNNRLHGISSNKIVLIGGSNLTFGIDSPLIELIAGCPAVNMGMNGALGVRYMIAEAEAGLRSGDIAVIALEYDSFVQSVEGSSANLLWIARSQPSALAHMTFRQRVGVLAAFPAATRSKVERILGVAMRNAHTRWFGGAAGPDSDGELDLILGIESLSGFTPEGDLVSHLGVDWPYRRELGQDMTRKPVDPDLMPLIRDFSNRMHAMGVEVLFSYSPLLRDFHVSHRDAITRIGELVRREMPATVAVPSDPETFVYDPEMFFDTVYHLNREGRDIRSRQLANDVIARRTPGTQCRGSNS